MALLAGVRADGRKATTEAEAYSTPLDIARIYEKKIGEINAEQIDLIGSEIVRELRSHLGIMGNAFVAHRIMLEKDGLSEQERSILIARQELANRIIPEARKFFSEKFSIKFLDVMLFHIKQKITEGFSNPSGFMRNGMTYSLSDHQSEGIVKDTCKKVGIAIDAAEIPTEYYIVLKLDTNRSQERSTLVFSLTHHSRGAQFLEAIFTIECLDREFQDCNYRRFFT